jgi:hypothetical protein
VQFTAAVLFPAVGLATVILVLDAYSVPAALGSPVVASTVRNSMRSVITGLVGLLIR